MSIRPALSAATLALVATTLACAAPRFSAPASPGPARAARARFEPPHGDAIFANAVRVLARSGYALDACDPDLAVLATAPVELDVPCRGGSCLARQRISVKLGYRMARVIVTREVWDFTEKDWKVAADSGLEHGVATDEAELLAEILDVPGARMDAPSSADACDPGTFAAASTGGRWLGAASVTRDGGVSGSGG